MSFSQSLLIGDNTLRELDKCENERVHPAEFVTPSGKRKCSTTNNVTLVKKSCEYDINNDANNNKEANAFSFLHSVSYTHFTNWFFVRKIIL